jgi:ADP-ribose pyrophosphatase YjhB (NUDIX family)
MDREPQWLEWAKKLQSIAQAGIAYTEDKYDRERFQQIRDVCVDILHHYTEIDAIKIRQLFASEIGYQTPKIDVRAAVFKGNEILMIREKIDGLWALPGGWADIDTSLRETLIKEAKEEAGANIQPKRIIAVLDRRNYNAPPALYGIYKIFAECDYIDGSFKSNIETSEAGFFTQKDLPPLSTGRNTEEQIAMCFNARKKTCHEAFFD